MKTIDIIIPSYRLQSKYLLSIIQMDKPDNYKVRFIIIADNPKIEIPTEITHFIDNKNIILFRNEINGGSSYSRNVGINNSNAEWILFIDDDVKPNKDLINRYVKAIEDYPNEIGFFGETLMPEPKALFSKGIIASDILTFFFLAGYYDKLKWAPTSNVLIKKSAIGKIRFQEIFPKNGGGEDIDFFLQINKKTKQELICLKDTIVHHDWWYDEKRNYTRFTRWSFGDTLLHEIYPEFTYYNFPNIIESLVLSLPFVILISILTFSFNPVIALFFGIFLGEIFIEFIRLLIYKGFLKSLFALETVLIRASNDIGRLSMQLIKLKRFKGICERFDHFCDGRHIKYQKIWAFTKFISYIIASIGIYYLIK